MPVAALLADKDSGLYIGVRLASGQDIFSQKLVIDPHFVVPRALALSGSDSSERSSHSCSESDTGKKVARGICIAKASVKSDASNLLIVYPPRSLYPEQVTSVRALQLSGNTAVCPAGMFVLHLSTLCDDASQGKRLLTAAINTLFRQCEAENAEANSSENPRNNSLGQSAATEEQKPILVWSALYVQEITEGSVHTICTSPSPDGNLIYNDLINVTEKMFQQLFPGEDFFPEEASTEEAGNNEDIDPEL